MKLGERETTGMFHVIFQSTEGFSHQVLDPDDLSLLLCATSDNISCVAHGFRSDSTYLENSIPSVAKNWVLRVQWFCETLMEL